MLTLLDKYFLTTFLSGWVLYGSFKLASFSLENGKFLKSDISQGSVATFVGCGGIFIYGFIANLIARLTVKELWKSANIWRSYGQRKVWCLVFLAHSLCWKFPSHYWTDIGNCVFILVLELYFFIYTAKWVVRWINMSSLWNIVALVTVYHPLHQLQLIQVLLGMNSN